MVGQVVAGVIAGSGGKPKQPVASRWRSFGRLKGGKAFLSISATEPPATSLCRYMGCKCKGFHNERDLMLAACKAERTSSRLAPKARGAMAKVVTHLDMMAAWRFGHERDAGQIMV